MPETKHLNSDTSAVIDRRAHERRTVSSFTYVEVGDKNGGVIRDLSQNGVAVQAAEPLVEGESVSIRFRLPNTGTWIHATGRVAWQGKSARIGGIQFVDLPDGAKAEIDLWISSQTRRDAGFRARSRTYRQHPPASAERDGATPGRADFPKASSDVRDTGSPSAPVPSRPPEGSEAAPQAADRSMPARDLNTHRPQPEANAVAPTPPDLYQGRQDARYRRPAPFTPEVDLVERKPRRWGTAAAMGILVLLLVVLGATFAPQELRDNVVQQVKSFAWRYTDQIFPSHSQDVPSASTNGSANPASANVSPARKSDETDRNLPAQQDPVAAFPLNNAIPLELQPQQIAPIPKGPESTSKGSGLKDGAHLARDARASKRPTATEREKIEAKKTEDGRKKSIAAAVREKREIPRSRAPQSTRISEHPFARGESLQAVAAKSTEDAYGSYSADGFLDLPETPVSASSEFAITIRRTIPLRSPVRPQPGYEGQSLKIGSLVYHVDPIYPDEALRGHVQGMVELHATIGPDGNVESVEPVSGPISLIPAAMGAVRQWQYGRTLHYGQPIRTEADVDIAFRLP